MRLLKIAFDDIHDESFPEKEIIQYPDIMTLHEEDLPKTFPLSEFLTLFGEITEIKYNMLDFTYLLSFKHKIKKYITIPENHFSSVGREKLKTYFKKNFSSQFNRLLSSNSLYCPSAYDDLKIRKFEARDLFSNKVELMSPEQIAAWAKDMRIPEGIGEEARNLKLQEIFVESQIQDWDSLGYSALEVLGDLYSQEPALLQNNVKYYLDLKLLDIDSLALFNFVKKNYFFMITYLFGGYYNGPNSYKEAIFTDSSEKGVWFVFPADSENSGKKF